MISKVKTLKTGLILILSEKIKPLETFIQEINIIKIMLNKDWLQGAGQIGARNMEFRLTEEGNMTCKVREATQ